MSNFRRAPNVSQYIANLNTISPQDTTSSDELANNDMSELVEMDPILTADFFNFEIQGTEDFKLDAGTMSQPTAGFEQPQHTEDFLTGDFNFNDFPELDTILDNTQAIHHSAQQPLQPLHQYPAQQPFQIPQQPLLTPQTHAVAEVQQQENAEHKRKLSEFDDSSQITEESARVAAEEDKRRRNTAASARFRVKKKQREADLEQRAKEMTTKATLLETKVQQLEMENKWLKSLITERRTNESEGVLVGLQGTGNASMRGKDLGSLWTEFVASQTAKENEGGRDGVGTTPAAKKLKAEK